MNDLTYEEKLKAILYMQGNDIVKHIQCLQSFGWGIVFNPFQAIHNESVVNRLFDLLARQEYLKYKASFLIPPPLRDSRGRYTSTKKND